MGISPQQQMGGGGWTNYGGMWSPFGGYGMGMQPNYNPYSTPMNFINPAIASPGLNQEFQQNPQAIQNAFSMPAFAQFPFFYGNQSGYQNNPFFSNPTTPFGPLNLQGSGGGATGGTGGGGTQVMTQNPSGKSKYDPGTLYSARVQNPGLSQGTLYGGTTGMNAWMPQTIPNPNIPGILGTR